MANRPRRGSRKSATLLLRLAWITVVQLELAVARTFPAAGLQFTVAWLVGNSRRYERLPCRQPANAKNELALGMLAMIEDLLDDLTSINSCIKIENAKVEVYASEYEAANCSATMLGLRVLGATSPVAKEGDGQQFNKARDLGAWLRLTPTRHSTGGMQILLGGSKRSKRYMRRRIILVAGSCLSQLNPTRQARGDGLFALDARTQGKKRPWSPARQQADPDCLSHLHLPWHSRSKVERRSCVPTPSLQN
jgi:hypothetical protein